MARSRDEFRTLPLPEIEVLTGLRPPEGGSAEEVAAYREKAWESYELDLANKSEWGTARQDAPLPAATRPPPDAPETADDERD